MMAKLARNGSQDPLIRDTAVKLTRWLEQKDWFGEFDALNSFTRDKIRYLKDTDGVELLHHARYVLINGSGDCDDKCILLAALLLSIGHRGRFIAIALRPEMYSHVWLQVKHKNSYIDLEPTEPIQSGQSVPLDRVVSYVVQDF